MAALHLTIALATVASFQLLPSQSTGQKMLADGKSEQVRAYIAARASIHDMLQAKPNLGAVSDRTMDIIIDDVFRAGAYLKKPSFQTDFTVGYLDWIDAYVQRGTSSPSEIDMKKILVEFKVSRATASLDGKLREWETRLGNHVKITPEAFTLIREDLEERVDALAKSGLPVREIDKRNGDYIRRVFMNVADYRSEIGILEYMELLEGFDRRIRVEFESVPEAGARVVVLENNQFAGKTDRAWAMLDPGKYRVEFTLFGYETKIITIVIPDPPPETHKFIAVLQPLKKSSQEKEKDEGKVAEPGLLQKSAECQFGKAQRFELAWRAGFSAKSPSCANTHPTHYAASR